MSGLARLALHFVQHSYQNNVSHICIKTVFLCVKTNALIRKGAKRLILIQVSDTFLRLKLGRTLMLHNLCNSFSSQNKNLVLFVEYDRKEHVSPKNNTKPKAQTSNPSMFTKIWTSTDRTKDKYKKHNPVSTSSTTAGSRTYCHQ